MSKAKTRREGHGRRGACDRLLARSAESKPTQKEGKTMKNRHLELVMLLLGSLAVLPPTPANMCAAPGPVSPKLVAALTGSDGPIEFGYTSAIDGKTVVATGGVAVYLFVEPTTGWANMTETAKLTASDGATLTSVSISGDTVVAGADGLANGSEGAAYVFVKPADGWTSMTETAKLTPSDRIAGDAFGFSVAISGNIAVVGAAQNNSIGTPVEPTGPGAAYVYVKPQNGWTNMTETAKLTASDGVDGDDLGWAIDFGNDTVVAGAVVAGAPNAAVGGNSVEGAVYVFVEPSGGWTNMTETAKLTNAPGGFDNVLGQSVSLSRNTVVAGGFNLAFVFVKPPGGWTDMSQTAQLTDSSGRFNFGQSVSIYGDVAVVTAPTLENLPSAADIFIKPMTGWVNASQTTSVRPPAGSVNASFGISADNLPRTIVVGDPRIVGSGGNAVYVFQ